jgi:hypothetical protein
LGIREAEIPERSAVQQIAGGVGDKGTRIAWSKMFKGYAKRPAPKHVCFTGHSGFMRFLFSCHIQTVAKAGILYFLL